METDNKTAPVSAVQDQNQISLDLMNRMKMHGMAEAFRESLAGTTAQSMTPDSFLSMLLAREWDWRAQAAIARLTRNASFRYKAYMEEIDYTVSRGLDRNQMERKPLSTSCAGVPISSSQVRQEPARASWHALWDMRPASAAYAPCTAMPQNFSAH